MKNRIYVLVFAMLVVGCNSREQTVHEETINTRELTLQVFEKGRAHCELDFYAGTLMLHGMAEFALLEGNEAVLDTVVYLLEKFSNGEINAKGNFISYEAGGTGAAYVSWQNAASSLDSQVFDAAEKMMRTQKRTHDNIMTAPNLSHEMFIDVVFTVTPFLLYAGLKFDKPEWVDYAVFQTLASFNVLKDEDTGLVHQGRGFQGEGVLSEDCWSRGNGWGAFALAILARDLPDTHPKRKDVEELATQFFTTVLEFQNEQGLWHQEMTAPESYVETSGSGLLLYGLGLVLEKGLLPGKYMKNFETGVENYASYVGSDGSVSHCAFSCRCPGDGSKEVYIHHPWVYNDHHAFGPAILVFAQAAKMGYDEIVPAPKLGEYTIANAPEVPRTYGREARGSDLAWENDRIAFRVFGPSVRDKVASGIDVWAKSVAYPILDKWFKLNDEGKDYHIDRGEGCDFYNMGKRSGCGGLALWIDGEPYRPETFDGFRIIRNQDDKIEFDIHYRTWHVPGLNVSEKKKIQMEKGTNLFKVTSTIHSEENQEITVAIGLSTFGKASVNSSQEMGFLSVWESFEGNGNLGTIVRVNPEEIVGFASHEGDEFVLIKAQTNQPFTYFAGAGWDKNGQFNTQTDWEKNAKN
ncbi:MAG: DUF4861 family protein [Cyclobacteriaceae bacterium]|nr:DUF4861 family protein [Cyclobacteriaceae bacterium]